MYFKNSRLWVRHSSLVAVRDSLLIVLLAFLARFALHEVIKPYAIFHFFMVACLIIAFRYGYKLAFLSLIVSYLLGNYFFVKPYGQFGEVTTDDLIQAFNFFLVTGVAIVVIEKLQRTIYMQKLLLKVMSDRHRSMLFRKNELAVKIRNMSKDQ
jgi:K+-sensing histidine kinase KdpD